MPELPEVETTVRGLARHLEGARIERVSLRRPDMRFPFPEGLVHALTGARVTGLSRRAKYGLIDTDRGRTLIFHLGMSGRWRIDPSELGKHDHLVIETPGHRFALNDPRRFGFVDLVDTAALDAYPAFAAMGPEPLGEGLTPEHLSAALAGRRQTIKLLLLDQHSLEGGSHAAGAGDPGRAPCRDRRRRLDLARLRAARWRAGLFRDPLHGLRPRGQGMPPGRRRDDPPDRPGRAQHLVLPEVPEVISTEG